MRLYWFHWVLCWLLQILVLARSLHIVEAFSQDPHSQSSTHKIPSAIGRRDWIHRSVQTSALITLALLLDRPPVHGIVGSSSFPERDALLQAISSKSSDDVVLNCIDKLLAAAAADAASSSSPTSTRSTRSASASSLPDRIDGRWKLIWSIKDDKFSPLLQLPGLLKPTSYQFVGSAAVPVVGGDRQRIAQLLTNGILGPVKTWLSSGVQEYNDSTLQIQPPFRLELEIPSNNRFQIVEAGSDADFRAINVRSTEAQQAPPNLYQQLYVDDEIGPGSIRISKIIEGDPVIVGATFVHVKL